MDKRLIKVIASHFALQSQLVKEDQTVKRDDGPRSTARSRKPFHSHRLHPMLVRFPQRSTARTPMHLEAVDSIHSDDDE